MRAKDFIKESIGEDQYVVYVNGNPEAYYNAQEEAERVVVHLRSKGTGAAFEIKKRECQDVPVKSKFAENYAINEEIVDEAPLPPDWDERQYAPGSTFKARLAYALERARKIGTGSSRVATIIEYQGRPTVLKIAKNRKGLAQNAAEASILSDGYARSMNILIPLIDYDEQNREPTWIHVEAAKKATEKTLCDLMKCPDLYMLYNFAKSIAGQPHRSWSKEKNMDWMRENYSDSDIEIFLDYAQQLAELAVSFNVEIGDFTRAANWGIYQGRPVVIDIGFTTDVKNTYYNRR